MDYKQPDLSEITLLEPYAAYIATPASKLTVIRTGLQSRALKDLLQLTGIAKMDIARILDITEPTLRKHMRAGKALNSGLSEHILLLFELFDKGIDTFGSLDEFKKWLPHHNIGIDAKPIDLLDSMTGIGMVMNELHRIDYGIWA